MKKKWGALWLLVLIPLALAAPTVTLNEPNDANTSNQTTIIFTCSVSDSSSITLYTNMSGSWAQTGSTVSDVSDASFTVSSIAQGKYIWNCFAENANTGTAWASSNRSLIVSTLAFSGTIPDQSWTEDTNNSNAFDIDTYFTGATSYSVSGNTSIIVIISTDNVVSFSPAANFSGARTVTITGSNGIATASSNSFILNVTNVNDAPYLLANISNQSTAKNINLSLDMSKYVADPDNQSVNYSISATHFTASKENNKLLITPAKDWEGTEAVTITTSDGTYSVNSNSFTITVGSGNAAPSITSKSPESNPTIEPGDSQEFSITASDAEGSSLIMTWYVDGIVQETTSSTLKFTPEEEGVYTVKVAVSDGTSETSYTWTIIVGKGLLKETEVASIIGEQTTTEVCGNGIVEDGEDCSTCVLDVPCGAGSVCTEVICEAKGSSTRAIGIFILVVFGIVGIAILIYYTTTVKNSGRKPSQTQYSSGRVEQVPPSDYTDFYQKRK